MLKLKFYQTLGIKFLDDSQFISCLYMNMILLYMTKKKLDCINHAVGTMPIGKPLAHHEAQLLSSVVLQFL